MWSEFLDRPELSEPYLQLLCHRKHDGSSNYWADSFLEHTTGSRLWTLNGSPDSQETKTKASLYIKEAIGEKNHNVTIKLVTTEEKSLKIDIVYERKT